MLGEVLRAERERQHLRIQDIEEGTSIRAVYIEAIESGDYKRLPGDVYTKGFIKNYANFLNLNGDELVKQFVAECHPEAIISEDVENVEPVEKVEKIKITDLPETNMKLPKKEVEDSEPQSNSGSGFKLVAAVVMFAVVAAGVWAYISGISADISDVDTNNRQPAAVADNKQSNDSTLQTEKDPAANTVSAATPQTGINLQAKFSGDCWTQVIADGSLVYEDTATAGQVMSWQGKENVTIRVGNAGVVELMNNGQNLGTPGAFGEVTERTFTRNSSN